MQRYTVYYIWKLLYMFQVVVPPETCTAVSRYNKLCNVASCWTYIRTSVLLVVATLIPFFILESRLVQEFAKQIYMKTGIQ